MIYSKKILLFIKEIKAVVKDVLSQEVGLKVNDTYFLDRRNLYPINIVIYNDRSLLGYFDSNFFELGFHECLMLSCRQKLHELIRHELGHYLTFIKYGSVQSHGPEFRAVCQAFGWGEEVYKATTTLETNPSPCEESSVFRKVKKLMALSLSSNPHEAEQAMIKSQQLLLKHNIEYIETDEDEKVHLKRVMKCKRKNSKMRAIGSILGTFFVSVVFNRTKEFTCLEIVGTAVNVEIAEYVAVFLDHELDKLWKQSQLKGTIAKNSFFHGIARGYCCKIQELKSGYGSDIKGELRIIEKQLTEAIAMVYKRLSTIRSYGNHCAQSSALGEQMGRMLNIKPAVQGATNNSTLLIEIYT